MKKPAKLFTPYVSWRAIWNVVKVLRSGQLAEGPQVKAFEQEFSEKFGLRNVLALNSGTTALELAYRLAGIKEGDEVIVPVLTCTATNLPLLHLKAKIVFADVDYSLNVDPDDIERKITPATRAIVFVHLGGDSTNAQRVRQIASARGIPLIEDAAQAVGGEISGDADFTAISLQAIKSLTSGDGGFLVCKSDADYERGKKLRWFGYDREAKQRSGDIDLLEPGFKWHMNDISAAIGRGNLASIDKIIDHRRRLMRIYNRLNIYSHESFRVVPSLWATKVIDRHGFYEGWKRSLRDLCEVGQYHFRNDKYTVFNGLRYGVCLENLKVMNELDERYFFLPMHQGISEELASRIVTHILNTLHGRL